MKTPKISVVMTCYNHEKFIKSAVDSILYQTIKDIELIIVNDGSSDQTSLILEHYTDPRITIINQKNSGTSSATNAGIKRCNGEYIALMSGDDISVENRFEIQLNQLNNHNCDIVFCVPQIIDEKSNEIDNSVCPWFFGKKVLNTYQLYRDLFLLGNFLCAPSAFMKRSLVEQVGLFSLGLIQLQDFDYWVRACKTNAKILLFNDPVIKYRYLPGANLSDPKNMNRGMIETQYIYDTFLEKISSELFLKAFENDLSIVPISDNEIEIEKMLMLYHHTNPIVQMIGAKKIIAAIENDKTLWRLVNNKKFSLPSFFVENNRVELVDKFHTKHFIKERLETKPNIFSLNKNKRNQMIQRKLEQGKLNEAVSLLKGDQIFKTNISRKFTLRKIIRKLVKIFLLVIRKIQKYFSIVMKHDYYVYCKLESMLGYCQRNNHIFYQGDPEKIFLSRPEIIAEEKKDLFQGYVKGPIPYVSILQKAIITSDSNLVVTKDGFVLNDEMVNYSGEAFGIKSPYVQYCHDKHVIIGYKKFSRTKLDQGILISNGHDYNYFHWLLESLPRLLFIDDFKKFDNWPIIVPKDLHPNLLTALEKIKNNHPIIKLEAGVSCMVKTLAVPSSLSTVIDRYDGVVKYNKDIILSHKWISCVSNRLQYGNANQGKPWRKLFLTRRNGLRALENIEELEKLLLSKGFEIVDLEKATIDSQIILFSQAKCIISPTGASITNIIFCQPNTKVLIFMSDHELTNYYMWSQLGDIFKLDIKFMIGKRKYNIANRYSVHDDYIIDFTEVIKELQLDKATGSGKCE